MWKEGRTGPARASPAAGSPAPAAVGPSFAASRPPAQAAQHADWLAGGCGTAVWGLLPLLGTLGGWGWLACAAALRLSEVLLGGPRVWLRSRWLPAAPSSSR